MTIHSPLYKQIAERIKKEIIIGKLKKDDAIPPEIKLSEMYDVSRVTIRQAIGQLVSEDFLYKIRGSGTYVKGEKIEQDIFRLQSFTEEMRQLGKIPSNEILDFHMQEADEVVQEKLQLDDEEKVFFIRRLRYADDEPLILEETYMPVSLFPDLSIEVMRHSKYAYVENKGYIIKERQGEVFPFYPTEGLKKVLQLEEHELTLSMNLWAALDNGTIFEYTKLYFRSDKYTFKFVSKRI
ncbi:GntR family transcriptional regulator [Bacillus sp. B1-b2]|uniref:GntR family transcriptional regulator n=1 Tax=Bacillus sp. B1-b2 TaxID=2653201 RepID=UPI0012623FBE|nr:GntR family transcriptional regulator [Bacillus sp. B1-b2]KAB7673196.1 GntR family transcriptional regulator [Bacillus sp. B1-b2]